MKTFIQEVDTQSREAMIEYLAGHFRYYTMGSHNLSTSYAHNMKIYEAGFGEVESKVFELIECEEYWWQINDLVALFAEEHSYTWQAGFNGRSSGYLVLYQGKGKDGVYCGRGVDQGEDFADWDMDQLRDRVKLIRDFDRLAEDILLETVRMARDYKVVDEEYTEVKTRKALVEVGA